MYGEWRLLCGVCRIIHDDMCMSYAVCYMLCCVLLMLYDVCCVVYDVCCMLYYI